MSLLQLLQEASTLDIPSLKKAMLKDKQAAILFNKDLTLDKIKDKDAFLATVKYWILNNDSVKSFIAMRNNVKDLDKDTLASYRKLRGDQLDENKLKWLKEFIQNIFKEHSSVSKGIMSPDLKRELKNWFNNNGRYFNLPGWARRELKAIPSIRPDKRMVLYRGVLFSEYDLNSSKSYDGTLEKGNGLKFLQSIRKGGKEVDLEWDRPSSWTTSKEVADRFAKYGPAQSQYGAMMQWFNRSIKKRAIDGSLGYVISTFVEPDSVLIDTARMSANIQMQHGGEGEVILEPGKYSCRIVKKYTVDGEVDPAENDEEEKETKAASALNNIVKFDELFQLPDEVTLLDDMEDKPRIWSSDATSIMRHPAMFKKLILNGTTTAVIHAMDKVHDFYNTTLKHLEDDDLRADKFATKEDLNKKVANLKKFIGTFNDNIVHPKFKTEKNYKSVGKRHELSGEEYRTTINGFDLKSLEKQLLSQGRITDRNGENAIGSIASAVGVKMPTSAGLSRFGNAKQIPIIDETLDGFYKMINLSKPEDRNEAIKTMINLIRKAHRNFKMLEELKQIKENLGELK